MSGSGHSSRKVKINSKYANPDIRADIWGPKTYIKMSGCGHCECPDLLGSTQLRLKREITLGWEDIGKWVRRLPISAEVPK